MSASTQAPVSAIETSHKVVVHHLNNSRSQRILWLLEELGIPYEIKKYQRSPELLAPKELKAVHPLGSSPVISDGELVLAESGAIIEYLIKKYGAGKLEATEAGYIDNLYYTHYAEGTLMPLLVNRLIFSVVPDRSPLLIRPVVRMVFNMLIAQMVEPRLQLNSDMIEAHLSKIPGKFFAGGDEPTAADFLMQFPLEAFASRATSTLGEETKKWLERVHARPAYQRALEKGGKYDYA